MRFIQSKTVSGNECIFFPDALEYIIKESDRVFLGFTNGQMYIHLDQYNSLVELLNALP